MRMSQRLGVLAMVIGSAAVGSVGVVYFRPAAPAQDAPAAAAAAARTEPAFIRTVTWFKAHRAELKTKYAACRDDPGLGMQDPECENALQAKQSAEIDDLLASIPAGKAR
jgi:hypothetical protein